MGKRNKDSQVGRRRQMIQLGGSSQKSGIGVVSRNIVKEDEKANNVEEKPIIEPVKDDVEDPLAGFLAEINSLEAPHDSSSTVENSTSENIGTLLYDPTAFDPATQGHLLPEPWQACYDETSSYYYYWNTVTNEVQWYPPVATIPPPPPPSTDVNGTNDNAASEVNDYADETIQLFHEEENITNVVKEDKNDTEPKTFSPTIDIASSNELISSNDNPLKNLDYGSGSDDEKSSSKNKDKELMSKIKEKIQKKKEEKLRKEKEEREKKEKEENEKKEKKDEEYQQKQKEKEEMLREKLIKKKMEREKVLNSSGISKEENPKEGSRKDSETLDSSIKSEESFAVDIFALDDNKSSPRKDIEKETEPSQKDSETDKLPNKIDVVVEHRTEEVVTEKDDASSKENKGGWRIIDAVYDDDDDDDDDDNDSEEEDRKPMREIKEETNEKLGEEMDDYAEMLLEGAIGEKDDTVTKRNSAEKRESFEPVLPPEAPPPPPPEDARPPLPPEDEPLPELPKVTAKEEEENRKDVGSLSTFIYEKLDFLGINNKDLRNLQLYFIELETRMCDWQAGALDSKYFVEKLQELNSELLKHEETAAPVGWICHWSSNFKMYYYHNTATGESQWEYPDPLVNPVIAQSMLSNDYQTSLMNSMASNIIEMAGSSYMESVQPMSAVDTSLIVPASTASLVSPAHGFTRDPIPTESKKRPAPVDAESSSDPYRDPYRLSKKKKDTPVTISSFPDMVSADDGSQYSDNDSDTSSPLPKSVIAAAPMMIDVSREASPALHIPPAPPEEEYDGTSSPQPVVKKESSSSMSTSSKPKVRKKKKVDTTGLPSKKLKHVSSLVQKWQTVKQQVEDEENVEEEEVEDYETLSERRINEWKMEVESSGKKDYNPNFTEIKGDWRERLKRKTAT